jgi:hypothetical protein
MRHVDDITEEWDKLAKPVELAVCGLTRDDWQMRRR